MIKHFFLFSLLLLLWSCGDSYVKPRIRLVKDSPTTFHFQWDEPLEEERIILVRAGHIDNPNTVGYSVTFLLRFMPGEFRSGDWDIRHIHVWGVETITHNPRPGNSFGFEDDVGDYVSYALKTERILNEVTGTDKVTYEIPSTLYVNILSHRNRSRIRLPASAKTAVTYTGMRHKTVQLLVRHPFKPYGRGPALDDKFLAFRLRDIQGD